MVKKVFSILIANAVLGLVLSRGGGLAQAASGVVRVLEDKLPKAEITATGIGYPPKRKISVAQKRLLAKRAATIDAYRTLAATVRGVEGYIIKGSGYIQTSGYIGGVSVTQVREFADGKVEVDLSLPVSFVGYEAGGKVTWDKTIANIGKKGYPVYYLKQPKREISEEEWLELTKIRN